MPVPRFNSQRFPPQQGLGSWVEDVSSRRKLGSQAAMPVISILVSFVKNKNPGELEAGLVLLAAVAMRGIVVGAGC